jgi:DHA1 family bicyclomycin/chloramphenicol resistance-like MFS transporter
LANALAAAFLFGGMFAYIAASPFAFMAVLGVSPDVYSAIFALSAFGIVAGSLAGPRLIRSVGRTPAVRGGLALGTAAGSLLLALALSDRVGALTLLVAAGLYMFSRGLVLPFAMAAAMEPMGRAAGLASGILGALQMAMAAIVTLAVSWVADPFVGMGAALAFSGAAALACGLWAQGGGVAQGRERLA